MEQEGKKQNVLPVPHTQTADPNQQGPSVTSFRGLVSTQFLGAFNDNFFKQLILLIAVPVGVAASSDRQGLATFVFSVPFVLFSGFAGFLSDRFSKTSVIRGAKIAEIAIMLLGMIAFSTYGISGFEGLLVVLFLMGTQSAFFGPAKYGILPEMLQGDELPRANGIIVMTTFLAIILGIATAGPLKDWLTDEKELALGASICVALAILGTWSSTWIRRRDAASPDLGFRAETLVIARPIRQMLYRDRPLRSALFTYCVFWTVAPIAQLAVNSLGLVQLKVSYTKTSLLTGIIAVGIAVGAMIAGRLCRGKPDFRIVRVGLWGMVGTLTAMSISLPGRAHLLGFGGSLLTLVALGISAGLFAIPIQAFIQIRPAQGLKGQMIAAQNLITWIGTMASGSIYFAFDKLVAYNEWPRSVIFALAALMVLPIAVIYRPKNPIES